MQNVALALAVSASSPESLLVRLAESQALPSVPDVRPRPVVLNQNIHLTNSRVLCRPNRTDFEMRYCTGK